MTPESQSVRVRTKENIKMDDIWRFQKQGACEELVESVDIFLRAGKRDENAKGTCYFLKGDCQRQLGNFKEAEVAFQTVIADYNDTVWPDPNVRGGYVPVRPQVDVGLRLVAEQDRCGFPEDSNGYTTFAWKYLDKERFDTAIFFAWECIRRFRSDAVAQQKSHWTEYGETLPTLWPEPKKNESVLQRYWALYDVGTCFFIIGQAYEYEADGVVKRGDVQEARRLYEKAIGQYRVVVTDYPGAQCFDPSGPWYWSVKKGAEERINRITDHKLKTIERG
jgi:tetratricopeptide (TPR) repeat protein